MKSTAQKEDKMEERACGRVSFQKDGERREVLADGELVFSIRYIRGAGCMILDAQNSPRCGALDYSHAVDWAIEKALELCRPAGMSEELTGTVLGIAERAREHLAKLQGEEDPARYTWHSNEARKYLSLIEETLKDSVLNRGGQS